MNNFIAELKAQVDARELIDKYVDLKGFGSLKSGHCPFHLRNTGHEDRHASFVVGPDGYHCMSCHEKGDAISFLEQYLSLNFKDAVAELANHANVPLPSYWEGQHSQGRVTSHPSSNKVKRKGAKEKGALDRTDWDKGLRALFKKAKKEGWYGDIDKETGELIWFNSACSREAIAELEKRGLTREASEAAGIFTLFAGRTEVTELGLPQNFPGTYWAQSDEPLSAPSQWLQGMWIDKTGKDCMVIPRFHFWDGSRVGCQLRALGPVEKNDRYRTLYSKRSASGNQLLYDKNAEAEPGLTFCTPELFGLSAKTPHRIYLSEAILKPLIACFKHNEFFAGAVSGLFLSSPQQFRDFLVYCQALGVTEIVICPDYNTFPTNEKPDGNPGFVTLWTEIYLWIHKEFPGMFEVLVAPAEGADIDEVNELPEPILFQTWLAGAIKSSRKIRKMVSRLRRSSKNNRFGLAEVWGIVRSLTKKVQDVARYFENKSSAIVPWTDAKRWESFYPSSPLKMDKLVYEPGNLDSIDWRGRGPTPTIFYTPGTMKSLISDLYHEFGKAHIINTGKPGEGKSHEISSAHPDDFGLEIEDVQIERENGEVEQCGHESIMWYFTKSPKNPTNLPLEKFFEIMKSRVEVLYAGNKTTPSGRRYFYTTDGNGKFTPIPNSGNCGRAKAHKKLMTLGYSAEYTTGLLCPTCPFYQECKKNTGTAKVRDEQTGSNDTEFPYGFIFERWTTIKEERQIHLHPSQSPTRRVDDGLIGISPVSDIAVFDDIQLDTTKDYCITIKAIQKTYWQIAANEQRVKEQNKDDLEKTTIAEQLSEILLPMLVSLMDDILSYDRKKFPHGMSDRQFWTEYGKGNRKENPAVEAYNKLMKLYPQPVELASEDIWIKGGAPEYIRLKLNRILNNGMVLRENLADVYRPQKVLEVIEEHALPQWLTAFLMAAIGKGSVGAYPGHIKVTIEDRSQVYRTRAAINLYLDATTTRERLARQIRVPIKDIVEIRPLPLDHANLTVQGIKGFGKLTAMSRSQGEIKRLRAIVKEQIEKWGRDKVSLIDHKVHIESGMYNDLLPRAQQGWWFCHNRGTNIFEQYPCRIAIGEPRTNWGRLASKWQATTGEQIDLNFEKRSKHKAFWKYERELTQAEIVQDVGRLRSGRKDEPCLYLKLGGDQNLDYLQKHYQNCTIENITADGEAAPKEKRNWIRLSDICQAFTAIQKRGEEPKLAAISNMIGLSTTMISRSVKQYGGFKAFPETCKTLLKELTADCKNPDPLDESLHYLASAAFPEALAQYEAKRTAALARMKAGEFWMDQLVADMARALTDYTMELIAPIAKMPAVPMSEFIYSLSPESRQGLWQAVLTLFPCNPVLDELEAILDFSPG